MSSSRPNRVATAVVTSAFAASGLVALGAPAGAAPVRATAPAPAPAEDGPVVVDVLRADGVSTVAVADEAAGERLADRLEDAPDVLAADVATTYALTGDLAPAAGALPWHLEDVRAPVAWSTTTGADRLVAVLDSPVDASHPDLAGALLPEVDLVPGEGSSEHGTFVTSLVVGRSAPGRATTGVAPSARVLPVEVCGDAGCTSSAVADGVRRAVAAGVDVINLSLAGSTRSSVVESAVRSALSAGVVVVAASGNDGAPCTATAPTSCGNPVMYPAAVPGVVAVAASDVRGDAAPWAVHGPQVALTAPGAGVVGAAPGGGYVRGSGTSFAAPLVAGAAALVRSSAPGLSPAQVRDRLRSTAVRRPWAAGYGTGSLDAGDAVRPPAGRVADFRRGTEEVRLQGDVLRRYEASSGPAGELGWPRSGVVEIRGGLFASFERGSVYWSRSTGARVVGGDLLAAWGRTGWERGPLGYPREEQLALRRDGGLLQRFQGGFVYASRATGAHAVRGPLLDAYGRAGWENGVLGYPTGGQVGLRRDGGLLQRFQGGFVYWSPATGGHVVRGALLDAYGRAGWESGRYGYPTGEQRTSGDRLVQPFQGGTLQVRAR